jgi:RNA polymerase sigma-70 factor (ECF subfamily)
MDKITMSDASGGADLVGRIRAGDRRAEEELYQRYNRGVLIIIRRQVGNAGFADDLHQETFRIALEKIRQGDIREPEKLSGFICAIARNLVIGHFRRTSRRESLSENDDFRPQPDPTPNQFEEVSQKEMAEIVRQVIREMNSERDRQLLFRFYIAEEPKERICTDLGLTSLHFNRVLFRARERFRELYIKKIGKG